MVGKSQTRENSCALLRVLLKFLMLQGPHLVEKEEIKKGWTGSHTLAGKLRDGGC